MNVTDDTYPRLIYNTDHEHNITKDDFIEEKVMLLKKGKKIEATIDKVSINNAIHFKGKNPYQIELSYKEDGKTYNFIHKELWFDVNKVIEDYNEAIDKEVLKEKITDYYSGFDYIVGDWAYGKLRLKGFYDRDNKKAKDHNNIDNVKKYIEEKCAYGCKWFEIKKID